MAIQCEANMSSHERRGDSAAEPPEREKLEPGEIDLTGVVDQLESLVDVIRDAIAETGEHEEVPDWGARVMGRFLASFLPDRTSALHHFAVTGRIELDQLIRELHVLWREPARTSLLTEVINRLGTYLIAQTHQSNKTTSDYPERIRGAIEDFGPPFEAFVKLIGPHNVAADIDETLSAFADRLAGSFWSIPSLHDHIVEKFHLEDMLRHAGIDHIVSIDPTKVMRIALDTYNVVYHDGRYFCFWKIER